MFEIMQNLPELPQSIGEQLKALSRFLVEANIDEKTITLVYFIPVGEVDYSTGSWENLKQYFPEFIIQSHYHEQRRSYLDLFTPPPVVYAHSFALTMLKQEANKKEPPSVPREM